MAIQAMSVWHGPVYGLYKHAAEACLEDTMLTEIDCRDTSPNSLPMVLPEGSILAADRNGVWLRGIHEWNADDTGKAMKYLDHHPLDLEVAVTSDRAPLKAVADRATVIHGFQIPKSAADYARQIEDWLLLNGHSLERGVAAKLVKHCAPEPEAAQNVAVSLTSMTGGTSIPWSAVETILADIIKDKRPVWDLGNAIAAGDAESVLRTLSMLDNAEPFVVMRYLENRYRQLLLAAQRTPRADIKLVFPKANDWVLDKTAKEARSMKSEMLVHGLGDIARSFSLLLESGTDNAHIVVEQCALKLTARHRAASR